MTIDAAAARSPGLRTLEVRWIRPGRLPDSLIESLAPSPAEIEIREDRYLVAPLLRQIGLKFRGAVQLDLKVFRGSPGDLELAAGARGVLEFWQKWTVPVGGAGRSPADTDNEWVVVKKLRRKRSFEVVGSDVVERPMREAGAPGCTVELTEVLVDDVVHGGVWWTLGLEAGGVGSLLERDLTATADFLFRPPLPTELALDRSCSMSYVEWLRSLSQGSSSAPSNER